MIEAAKGQLVNFKGGLRANHRFFTEDSFKIEMEQANRSEVSPSKMPQLNPYRR